MFVDALANGRRLRVRQHKVKEERRKILHVRSGPDRGEECRLEDRKRERVIFEQRKEPLFIEIAQLLRDLHVIVDVVEKLICDIEYIIRYTPCDATVRHTSDILSRLRGR